jgi:hypothetical protein
VILSGYHERVGPEFKAAKFPPSKSQGEGCATAK